MRYKCKKTKTLTVSLFLHFISCFPGAREDSTSSGAWHMEYFVLVVLAPLTVVCLCCVIMFYYRRSSRLASHSSSLPTSSYSITSDNPPVSVSVVRSSLLRKRNTIQIMNSSESSTMEYMHRQVQNFYPSFAI